MANTKTKKEKPVVDHNIITVEAEEVSNDDQLVRQIDTALVKANVTERVIGELKQKYSDLRLASLDDHEGYLVIKEARKEVRGYGILTEKICEKGREDAIRIQRLWLGKQKEVLAKIAEVQEPLDAEIKRYEDEEERKEQERIKRIEDNYILRQQALNKMGIQFLGGEFILTHEQHGDVRWSAAEIKEAEDSSWDKIILPTYTELFNKIEAARIAEENRKKQEDEDRRNAQAKLEEERRAMLDERMEMRTYQLQSIGCLLQDDIFFYADKIRISAGTIRDMEVPAWKESLASYQSLIEADKEQKKKKAENDALIEKRISMLNDVFWNGNQASYKKKKDGDIVIVTNIAAVLGASDEDWNTVVLVHNNAVELDKQEYENKIRNEAAEKERRAILGERRAEAMNAWGCDKYSAEHLGNLGDEQWLTLMNTTKGEYNQKLQQIEDEMSDREKWKNFTGTLPDRPMFAFKSKTYRAKLDKATEYLNAIRGL